MKANLIVLVVAFTIAFALDAGAQMVRMMPFGVHESALIEQIRSLRLANPKIAPNELAKAANDLMLKHGIAYKLYFDAATCQKIREVKNAQKDPKEPIKIGVTLQSIGAERAALTLPKPNLTTPECGDCYVELPILEMTDSDFVTLIQGHNIKFSMPGNFTVNRVHLLDNADVTKKVRTWRVPFRAVPIGVTYDQTVIYLAFENPELAALSLAVFDTGGFEITTRAEAEEAGIGRLESPKPPSEPGYQVIRFDRWENIYRLSYKPACGS